MLNVRTAAYTYIALHTHDVAFGIHLGTKVTARGIVQIRFVSVHQIPVRAREIVTLEF